MTITSVVVVGFAAWIFTASLRKRSRFIKIFRQTVPGKENELLSDGINSPLLSKSRFISRVLKGADLRDEKQLLYKTGIAKRWIDTLATSPKREVFKLILSYNIYEGVFHCFQHALERRSYKKVFKDWLEKNRDRLPLQTVAHAGNGENFNGRKAYQLFSQKEEEIKDMLGDPNWKGRFFSLKILLHSRCEDTRKSLLELLKDPSPLVRKTVVTEFPFRYTEEMGKRLLDVIQKDPNSEVRQAARKKYRIYFGKLPDIKLETLPVEERLHIIEAFMIRNKDDEAKATDLVLSDNHEIRFYAARFLERSGTLSRYCSKLDRADKVDFNRKISIMKNCASVGITGFLSTCIQIGSEESLFLASEILEKWGDATLIHDLAKKVFSSNLETIYRRTVSIIAARASRETRYLLKNELYKHMDRRDILTELIEEVTPLTDASLIDPLLEIIKKREDLNEITRKALLNKDNDVLVQKLIENLEQRAETSSQNFSAQALLLLSELKRDYCLPTLFENLPLLPVEFVRDLGGILKHYPAKIVKEKLSYYLSRFDGEIRAHVIALIPKIGTSDFITEIREGLNDSDPLVRISSIYALVEINDSRSFPQALSLLRDPVEEVRDQAALALGHTGKKEILNEMAKIFYDKTEVLSVKRAIIKGVSESKSPLSTSLLLGFLERDETLEREIIHELFNHTGEDNIKLMLDRMKDGGEPLNGKISDVFKGIGLKAKPVLLHLLESEIASLKNHASEVLDSIGGTDQEIKRLRHKSPHIRREGAKTLSLISTTKAFRGLIMASRDPDREVRVNVVKALEKLETKEGKDILNTLLEDPDAKIRKYTHWALEKLKAKALV